MKLSEILSTVKPMCKLDSDDTEFDPLLTNFINDTLIDLYSNLKQVNKIILPIINGICTIDDGYEIIKIEPVLNVGDKIIGKTIFTSLTGTLTVYVSEEAPKLVNATDNVDLPQNILNLIPYNVSSLWYAFKKKLDLSGYWYQYYNNEKAKRFKPSNVEETYEMDLPLANFFN